MVASKAERSVTESLRIICISHNIIFSFMRTLGLVDYDTSGDSDSVSSFNGPSIKYVMLQRDERV